MTKSLARSERIALMLACGAIIASTAACTFDTDFDNTRYACAESQVCPDGFGCVRGVCLAGVIDPGPCGTMAVAAHDFAAIDFTDFDDSTIWEYYSDTGTMEVQGGQLVFELDDTDDDVGSGFGLDKIFPRKDSSLAIEIVERSADATSGAYLLIEDRDGDHVEFYEEDGQLYAVLHTSADELVLDQFPFDPVAHRFWRIRESDGLFAFATSPDGQQWTEHVTDTADGVDGWLGAEVGLWKWTTGGGPARLVVDNLNGGVSDQDFCPSASLQDDFEDGERDLDWQLRDSNECTASERDGRLGFGFPVSGYSECAYRSYTRFDLRSSTISIEAPLADVPDLEQCLKLRLSDYQDIEFELFGGELLGEKDLIGDSGTLFSVTFDPVAHRYWRFRGEGDLVFWELSANGHDWQVMGSQEIAGGALADVTIELSGDTDDGEIDNQGASFDNLNIAPR